MRAQIILCLYLNRNNCFSLLNQKVNFIRGLLTGIIVRNILGIGLESVKDMIEKHNGSLDIYPKETIYRVGITLPLK
ncbi:MAG: ATP-binding protein [Lachnospiraceae bacterium]|nr:ATP-binding protein [Lachnospiraceae bacterium]